MAVFMDPEKSKKDGEVHLEDPLFSNYDLSAKPLEDELEKRFDEKHVFNFIALLIMSSVSLLAWHYKIFGATTFPWFTIIIAFFIIVWMGHYYSTQLFLHSSNKKKRKRIIFKIHRNLSLTINTCIVIIWCCVGNRKEIPWFIYPLCVSAVLYSLHYSFLWIELKYRWLMIEIFIFCVITVGDFCIWWITGEEEKEEKPYWVWFIVGFGGAVVLQLLIYRIYRYFFPSEDKEKKIQEIVSKLSPLVAAVPNRNQSFSYSSFSSYSTSSDSQQDSNRMINHKNIQSASNRELVSVLEEGHHNKNQESDNDDGDNENSYVTVNPSYYPQSDANFNNKSPSNSSAGLLPVASGGKASPPGVYTIQLVDDDNCNNTDNLVSVIYDNQF